MSDKIKINENITNGNLYALKCINMLNKLVFTEIKFIDDIDDIILNIQDTSNLEIDFNYLDNDLIFYSRLLNDLSLINAFSIQINKIEHKMNQRNLFLFLKYLKNLLNKNPDIYKDPLIKLNISIIIGFFKSGYGKKMINSIEYFYLCRKEIEKKYGDPIDTNKSDYDFFWINMAQKEIENLEIIKKNNYDMALYILLSYYNQKKCYEEIEIIQNIRKSFIMNRNLSIKELDKKYIHNEKYKKYLSDYLDKILKESGYAKDKNYDEKKEQLKNNKFFREIFNIDLNNINEVLFLLDINLSNIGQFDSIDNVYKEHIKSYESLIEESNEDLTDELTAILKSDDFMDFLKKILESGPVENYLKNKRKFNSKDNIATILNENENDFDDNLKVGYEKVINHLKERKDWLNNIIIIKYMSKKKRAFVNPLIRIVINPLYINISNLLKKEKEKRYQIFKAYLIITIIHELIHIFKFMKDKFYFSKIPHTPKNKEGGEIFINHLFGLSIINNITFEQANKINDIKSWVSVDELCKIFNDDKDKINKQLKESKTINLYAINYYLSDYEDEDEDDNEKQDYWYDYSTNDINLH